MTSARARLFACLLAPPPAADAAEEARPEYLIQPVPKGYGQVHQNRQHGTAPLEWVSEGESM